MRTPVEVMDRNMTGKKPDDVHAHDVHNYVFGQNEDGHIWQVGKCVICHRECRREGKTIQEMLQWELGG